MDKAIKINKNDNVAVALDNFKKGESVNIDGKVIKLLEDISFGHKIAIEDIPFGTQVIKYGYVIGIAKENIIQGSFVHSHNIKTNLEENTRLSYAYNVDKLEKNQNAKDYFYGYKRKDGKVGIRNEIWIIPMVGCVNSICKELEQKAREKFLHQKNIDDIVAFPHQFGCSQLGDDHKSFQKFLANIAKNPNAAGVLFVALGCENNTIESLKPYLGDYDTQTIKFIKCQDEDDEIEAAMQIISDLAKNASKLKREKQSVEKLIVGLKCGGSDGLSGITANPLVGEFSDMLISNNGSAILTEVPEMFGAEQVLVNRCKSKDIFTDFDNMIEDYKEYYRGHNQPIYENPSPGNKEGGITTLEEKSLGCVLKGGRAQINRVIDYADNIITQGLNLLSSPGNDLIAASALAAAGAQIILFTTGRGTPFSTVVPTIKISSNTRLFEKKGNWIDFNAGRIITESISLNDLALEFYNFILEICNGKKAKSEICGLKEIAFFKNGVTL